MSDEAQEAVASIEEELAAAGMGAEDDGGGAGDAGDPVILAKQVLKRKSKIVI